MYNYEAKVSDPVKAALNSFMAKLSGRKLTLEAETCMGVRASNQPENYTVVNRDPVVTANAIELGATAIVGEWDDVVFAQFMERQKFDVIFADFCTTIKDLIRARQGAHLMSEILSTDGVLMVTYSNRGVKDTYAKAMGFLQEKFNVLLTIPNRNMLTFVCMLNSAKSGVKVTQLLLKSLAPPKQPEIHWGGVSTLEHLDQPGQCQACNIWSKTVISIDGEGTVCQACWDHHWDTREHCLKCDHRSVANLGDVCDQCRPRLTYNARHLDATFAALQKVACPLSRAQIESCFKGQLVTALQWVNVIRKALSIFNPGVKFVKSSLSGGTCIVFGKLNMTYYWDEPVEPIFHTVAVQDDQFFCKFSPHPMPKFWLGQELTDSYMSNIHLYRFSVV